MNCGRIGFLFGNSERFRAFYLRIWDIHSSVVDACGKKFQNVTMAKRKSFASVSMQDDKPFDCLRTLFDCGDLWRHAASLIHAPTEVVKQRMQMGQFTSASAAVRLIAAKEGFKGLYAGYGSFLLRDLPFDAIQFCLYGQLRIGYKVAAKRELNDPENAIIGAFAGALTGAITTPLDVIKTRLMVQGSANQYKGIVDCVQTIVREEGPPALLKGIGPTVLWIGIGGSIFFGVLERSKRLLAHTRPTVGETRSRTNL